MKGWRDPSLHMIQQPFGKGIPVFAGGEPGEFFVGAGKIMVVRKAQLPGNFGYGFVGVGQQEVSLLDFGLQDILL